MKRIIIFIFAMILLSLNVVAFSTNPQDYVFWDDGDQIRNGTYNAAPTNNSALTTQRYIAWVNTGFVYNSSSGAKFGNMSIQRFTGENQGNDFFFGSNLTNVTLQASFYDVAAVTVSKFYMGFQNPAQSVTYTGGFAAITSTTNYWVVNGSEDKATSVARTTGWHNITFYISPDATYNVIYIDNITVANITINPIALSNLRMLTNLEAIERNISTFDYIVVWNGTPEQRPQALGTITSPIVNISLNDTSLVQNDGVNVTGNLSDDNGLSFCRFVINQTGTNQFFNKSVTGTSDQCSQNFTIAIGNGGVINFTIIVNDTNNNLNQSSLITTIGDLTAPSILGISLQRQPIMNTTQTNRLQINCSDTESFLDRMNFTIRFNQTTNNMTRVIIFKGGGGDVGIQSIVENEIVLNTRDFIWNYSLFQNDETAKEGLYNVTNVGCTDRPKNYAKNDSSNNLVGFDFLMDTPPTINSRSPTNSSTVTSTDTTGNAVITETNPSFMFVYHNITGTFSLNQTISYNGDGVTQNTFNLSRMTNGLDYVYSLSINTSFGTWTNTSNISFTVSVSSGGGSSGGGGGGGGSSTIIQTVINQTNVTIVENCNFNKICEGNLGEDALGCSTDCKLNTNFFTCDDPTQRCVTDAVKRLFTERSKVLNLSVIIGIIALVIVLVPINSPIGKYIKKPLFRRK